MKTRPTLPDSGVEIDNLLTMALFRRGRKRKRLPLMLLSLLGSISVVMTFLSMFSPPYRTSVILLVTTASVLFFSLVAAQPKKWGGLMVPVLALYIFLFFRLKKMTADGLVYLMNAIYQTIHQTDWVYYEPITDVSPTHCTTMLLCFLIIPLTGLLVFAVIRYHNFLLSLLVTFPLVEVGFYFGIVPLHLPAAGLFAFWCGMVAVQLAGSGVFQKNGKAGFMRRRNTFFPVSGMRFLLTEQAGIITAFLILVLFLAVDQAICASDYERSDKVKQMRTDFQHYAASVDFSDLSTIIPPFLKTGSGKPGNVIELGRKDSQEYKNELMSSVTFSDMPSGRIYLRYRSADIYSGNQWSRLDNDIYDDECIRQFRTAACYPPEFLGAALNSYGSKQLRMRLENADDPLSQCVPYGYQNTEDVVCKGDSISKTKTKTYTISAMTDYETQLLHYLYREITVSDLISSCSDSDSLTNVVQGYSDRSLWIPSRVSVDYYPDAAEKAAIMSACGYSDFARAHYLDVPDSPEMDEVRSQFQDLLTEFDAENSSPKEIFYELVLLRERLCSQVSYTLAPGKTPADKDFVAYFLLENKKGYCMHYASAGVLLARMAGIPARYCDGYLVDQDQVGKKSQIPGEDDPIGFYSAEILDSNAHAWCEVYIEGLGWVPFEFTYTFFIPPVLVEEEETTVAVTEEEETETFLAYSQTAPTSAVHEETSSTTETTTVPATELMPPVDEKTDLTLPLAGAGVVFVVLVGGVGARSAALYRRKHLFTQSDRKAAAACVWKWLLTLLHICGVDTRVCTADQLMEEAEKACGSYADSLQESLAIGARMRYSPHAVTEKELHLLRRTALQLAEGMYKDSGFFRKFCLKWFRHIL